MKLNEVLELLTLKEWTREELAEKLGLCRNTIDRWFSSKKDQQRYPSDEHVKKMRLWLAEARRDKIRAWQDELETAAAI